MNLGAALGEHQGIAVREFPLETGPVDYLLYAGGKVIGVIDDHTRLVCAQLGIRLLHSRPYHAWARGKVERFIHYLRYSFFHPLASRLAPLLVDVAMANREVGRWLDAIANRRVHAGTGAIPQQRLDEERPHLRPLPPPWRAQLPAAVAPAVVTVAPARPQAPAQHPLAVYDAFSHVGSAAP